MICGNASDIIDHPRPKHFVSAHGASHHVWAPGPHRLNPALACAHIKQSKTLANLSSSRQLGTTQRTRDEAIGDVDRNKHFNDVESYLFIKQTQNKWNLAAGTPKNLAVIESKCPSTRKHLSDCQKCKQRHNCVKQWNRPEIRILEMLQLPTTKCQAPLYNPYE